MIKNLILVTLKKKYFSTFKEIPETTKDLFEQCYELQRLQRVIWKKEGRL